MRAQVGESIAAEASVPLPEWAFAGLPAAIDARKTKPAAGADGASPCSSSLAPTLMGAVLRSGAPGRCLMRPYDCAKRERAFVLARVEPEHSPGWRSARVGRQRARVAADVEKEDATLLELLHSSVRNRHVWVFGEGALRIWSFSIQVL